MARPSEQPKYYAAANEPKAIWKVPGAEHTGGIQARPAEYERRVAGFFDHALLNADPIEPRAVLGSQAAHRACELALQPGHDIRRKTAKSATLVPRFFASPRSGREREWGYDHPVPTLPTGTVTFVFTDIEGSTRLLQELGMHMRT